MTIFRWGLNQDLPDELASRGDAMSFEEFVRLVVRLDAIITCLVRPRREEVILLVGGPL